MDDHTPDNTHLITEGGQLESRKLVCKNTPGGPGEGLLAPRENKPSVGPADRTRGSSTDQVVFGLRFPFDAGLTKQSTAKMISGFDLSPSSTYNYNHPKLFSGGIPAFICKPNLTLEGKPNLTLEGKPHLTLQRKKPT